MLFAQAFPLSFSIFWRLAMVMPFMLIGLMIYALVGLLLGFLAGFLIPALSFIVTFLIMASSAVIPTLIGTRLGLQAKEIRPSIKIWGLVVPAMVYGVVEGISMTLVMGLMIALSLLVTSPDISLLNEATDLMGQYLDPSLALPGFVALVAVFLSMCSIRASLLVPITSASIGRDPDGLTYTPFRHFRASFGPLFALTVLSYVGMVILHAILIVLILVSGYALTLQADMQELYNMAYGRAPIRFIWSPVVLFAIYTLIGVWTYSLQCAGGVLGYLKLMDGSDATPTPARPRPQPTPPPVAKSGPKMSSDELRALRKSRQFTGA